jgi:hypothetical protein
LKTQCASEYIFNLNSCHRKTFGLAFFFPASFDSYALIGSKHGYSNPNPLKTTSKILNSEKIISVQKNRFPLAIRVKNFAPAEGEDEEEDAGKADGVSIAPNTPRPKQQRVL